MIPSVQTTGMAVIRGPQFCLNCFTTALFPMRLRPEVREILLSYQQSILQLEIKNGMNLKLTGQIRNEHLRIRFHL